jgi:serine/threonine protein kinase
MSGPVSFGQWVVVRPLGSGAMGDVYLCERDSKRAAIKTIQPALAADPELRRRFAREVDALRRVNGEALSEILDVDVDAEVPWLACEYVAGPNLQQLVNERGPLAASEVSTLAVRLAGAIARLHSAGVVHRDVKPANVVWGPKGPVLVDLGISALADASRLTATGVVVGTPAFMAPEQFTDVDPGPSVDVFGWAGTIVFAALGRPPFGSGLGVEHRILHGQPDLVGLALPPHLARLVATALSKNPTARPTATTLSDALLATPQHESSPSRTLVHAPPTNSRSRVGRSARRWSIGVAIVAVICVVAAMGYTQAQRGGADVAVDTPGTTTRTATPPTTTATPPTTTERAPATTAAPTTTVPVGTTTSAPAVQPSTAATSDAPQATLPEPGLPEAPWAGGATPAPPELRSAVAEWADAFNVEGFDECSLLAPAATAQDFQASGSPTFSPGGSAGFAPRIEWHDSAGTPIAWIEGVLPPIDATQVADYYTDDAQVVRYSDGSEERLTGNGSSFIRIPGVACGYIVSYDGPHVQGQNFWRSLHLMAPTN